MSTSTTPTATPDPIDACMGRIQRLALSLDALAALGAALRVRSEGLDVAAPVRAGLDEVDALLGGATAALDDRGRRMAAAAIRAFFRQAHDLLEDPARAPGWSCQDPLVLESQGRGSAIVADVLLRIAPALDGLDARLRVPGARFLDVGTGAGWIALTMARAIPTLQVVGLDRWAPALRIAAVHVAELSLGERVLLREADVCSLDEEAAYDLAWLPGMFLGPAVAARAVERVARALRPGGWLVFGAYHPGDTDLEAALVGLRSVRAGGGAWTIADMLPLLDGNGLVAAREVERAWQAPLRLVAAMRAA